MAEKSLILRVLADASDAKRNIDQTRQQIDKLFEGGSGAARVTSAVAGGLSTLQVGLASAMPYIDGAITAAKTAVEWANFAHERSLMMARVGGAGLAALREGTRGLVDDTTLLKTASRAANGDLALNAEQMRGVAEAAVALSARGLGPVALILEDLTRALSSGETEGLKRYGVVVEGVTGKAAAQEVALRKLGRVVLETGSDMDRAGTAVGRLGVKLSNFGADVKEFQGGVVEYSARALEYMTESVDVRLNPAIERAIRLTREYTGQQGFLAGAVINASAAIRGGLVPSLTTALRLTEGVLKQGAATSKMLDEQARKMGPTRADYDRQRAEASKSHDEAEAKRKRELAELDRELMRLMDAEMDRLRAIEEQSGRTRQATAAAGLEARKAWESLSQVERTELQAGVTISPRVRAMQAELSQWDLLRRRAMNYGQTLREMGHGTFMEFARAGGDAFATLISGQEGAASSFADMARSIVQGLASRMAAEAIISTGLALRETFLNPPASASLWASAGVFTAGALAMGGVSAAMGPTSSQSAGAVSAPAPGSRSTAGYDSAAASAPATTEIVIKIGTGFVGDEKTLAREIGKYWSMANNAGLIPAPASMRRA